MKPDEEAKLYCFSEWGFRKLNKNASLLGEPLFCLVAEGSVNDETCNLGGRMLLCDCREFMICCSIPSVLYLFCIE